MEESRLTLDKAELFVKFPEIFHIFWKDWHIITTVEYEALEYLVRHSSRILLPNVTHLDPKEIALLRGYQGTLQIGVSLD